ncbi:hypothetical protein BHE74_00010301, partial [Ensete ventricosum]
GKRGGLTWCFVHSFVHRWGCDLRIPLVKFFRLLEKLKRCDPYKPYRSGGKGPLSFSAFLFRALGPRVSAVPSSLFASLIRSSRDVFRASMFFMLRGQGNDRTTLVSGGLVSLSMLWRRFPFTSSSGSVSISGGYRPVKSRQTLGAIS